MLVYCSLLLISSFFQSDLNQDNIIYNFDYYHNPYPFGSFSRPDSSESIKLSGLVVEKVPSAAGIQKIHSTKLVELHARFCKGTSASDYSGVLLALQKNPMFKPVIEVDDAYETTYEKQKYVVMIVDNESCQVISLTPRRADLDKFSMDEVNSQLSLTGKRAINTPATSIYEAGDGAVIKVFVAQYLYGSNETWIFTYPDPSHPNTENPDAAVGIATTALDND